MASDNSMYGFPLLCHTTGLLQMWRKYMCRKWSLLHGVH